MKLKIKIAKQTKCKTQSDDHVVKLNALLEDSCIHLQSLECSRLKVWFITLLGRDVHVTAHEYVTIWNELPDSTMSITSYLENQ